MIAIDHILMGMVIGLSTQTQDPIIIGATIAGSMMPDLDLLKGKPGTINSLKFHRGITHSLALSPIYAVIVTLLFFFLQNSMNFIELFLFVFLSILLHLVVDILNAYGTKVLLPFSSDKISLDLIFEFDPLFSAILILTVIFQLSFIPIQHYIAIFCLIAINIYVISQIVSRNIFIQLVNQEIPKNIILIAKSIVPAKYWRWKGIIETDKSYYIFRKINSRISIEEKPKYHIPKAMITSEIEIYREYSRHLLVEVHGQKLELHNLIYSPSTYKLKALFQQQNDVDIEISSPNLKYNDY